VLECAKVEVWFRQEVHIEEHLTQSKHSLRRHSRMPGMKDEAQEADIILASASPRRLGLLDLTGWQVHVHPVEVDESRRPGEGPRDLAARLARQKAQLAAESFGEDAIVVGADTVVADGGHTLGKPEDEWHAASMLQGLRGRRHQVITALAVIHPQGLIQEACITRVPMRAYGDDSIEAYIASGRPMDKAGAYGIQDREFDLVEVESLHGCFANVMGFPICHFARAMRRLREIPPRDIPIACQVHTSYDCAVHPEILRGDS
jgi:septum formation protein